MPRLWWTALLALVAAVPAWSGTILSEDFESGALDAKWTTFSSTPQGRIQVTGSFGTAAGSFALLMDVDQSGITNLNEAILTVDLSGQSQVWLNFSYAEWNDEDLQLPQSFSGSQPGDGVSISDDGANWHTVLNAWNSPLGAWQSTSIDLDAAVAAATMNYGPNFQIKFQQFDNFPLTTDGRGYDEISLTTRSPAIPEPSTWALFGLGTLGLIAWRRRVKA